MSEHLSEMDQIGATADDAPRRVHPGTVLIWFLKRAPQNVIALPALFGVTSGRGLPWIILAAVVIAAVSLFWTWLNWWRFTYAIQPGELVIESGVFTRNRRTIPLERIQDVSIERSLLSRIFGLSEVRVESGSGKQDEAVLNSVSQAEAQRLRDTLRGQAAVSANGDVRRVRVGLEIGDGSVDTDDTPRLIYSMSPQRVILSGLFGFSLVWIAALLTAVQFLGDAFGFGVDELIDWGEAAHGQVQAELSPAQTGLAVLLLGAMVVGLGVISGVVRALLSDWGFELYVGSGRFRRTRGLLTRSEVVLSIKRIQLALIERGPLRRIWGWQRLSLQTLGGSNDASGRETVAPLANANQTEYLIEQAGLPAFDPNSLNPVAPQHLVRAILGWLLVLPFLVAGGLLYSPLVFLALIAWIPAFGVALLQRRYHRYALSNSSLQVSRGVIKQRDWVVPAENVQSVTMVQGPIQRMLGLVTVHADTAGAGIGASPEVVDVSLAEGTGLMRTLGSKIV